ncbi:MAG: endolytic transglycosylase MltG [Lachnospiraceae bacterium]|nr:endolytic transglycosylase MltG [Lachnospiraceae bacterium]
MRNKKKTAIFIVIILLAVVVAFLFGGTTKTKKSAEVTIEEGTGSRQIADILKKEGVIGSQMSFLVKLKLSEYDGKLQYGTYHIEEGMEMNELFEMLATEGAKVNTVNITIPEGYTAEMIGAKLEEKGLFTKKEFLEAVSTKEGYEFEWLSDIEEKEGRKYFLQGYLYPDTYNVYKSATPQEVVALMLSNFEKHYAEVETDQSMDRIVTLASVIERETSVSSERSTIAGVIENRLDKGMRLQIDPTALYPLTDGMYNKTKVTYEDLKIDSPYNTYRNKGLPVGPICNPSVECMKAAAQPEEHEYLYYHTKSENSKEHDFYKTYEEHINSQK